jgi:hypothetical protein
MSDLADLEIIHIIWQGPLDVDTARKANNGNSDYRIYQIYNSAGIKTLRYAEHPILIVNHGRRHRLPEYVSTCPEFINTDQPDFMMFGANGHPVKPPIPAPGGAAEEACPTQ